MLILTPKNSSVSDLAISQAADILRSGGILAFPTETVYGLGARFDDEAAIRRIFSAKGRPVDNPLIVHIAHFGELEQVAMKVDAISMRLMVAFWPGPLTIVVPKSDH
ncbi:MAG: L-threonylcarbamoyladenylate synthase, partial [bacterium]|nr:L-threonylcarbamoyladenylate synthase [bacterium]